jgi:aminoglycoside phosphotransferase family enzyme/predicted kinase
VSAAPAVLAALADGAADAVLRETHLSWVLLAGERAYKVKKPVAFAFVDQRSLRRRRELCEAEVELNAALAPGVYRGVHAIVPAAAGFCLAPADDPAAVEYAVEMARFDEDATLAALVRRNALRDAQLVALAERLAAFHASARVVVPPAGEAAAPAAGAPGAARASALQRRFDANASELLDLLPAAEERRALAAQARCAHAYLAGRAGALAARAAAGHVRDCHGDLRAEHVLPGPPPLIVDRLEFSRALREIDVADELAFLAMDLTALGAPDVARALLDAYRAAGGDPGGDDLVAFHAIYRAHVRAKVALLRGPAQRAPAAALLGVAERFAWQLRVPAIVVVCGPAASGKSRLAHELAQRSGRPVLAADVVRKRLAGLPPTARADEERYAPGVSLRTYGELGRLAAAEPAGAIVDATFRRRADRDAFAAALDLAGADEGPVFAECVAPEDVLWERAAQRLLEPQRISDATPELALAQRAAFEALDEVPADRHHPLRSDRPPAAICEALAAARDAELAQEGPGA